MGVNGKARILCREFSINFRVTRAANLRSAQAAFAARSGDGKRKDVESFDLDVLRIYFWLCGQSRVFGNIRSILGRRLAKSSAEGPIKLSQ